VEGSRAGAGRDDSLPAGERDRSRPRPRSGRAHLPGLNGATTTGRPPAAPAIPVIDLAPYRAGDHAGTKRIAEAVGDACERIGFLVITGHGVPDALVRRVFDVSLAFFDLPLAEKFSLGSNDPGIPRGYSAFASKSLGRLAGSSRSTPAGATSTARSTASRP
jgi:hypothetical protein